MMQEGIELSSADVRLDAPGHAQGTDKSKSKKQVLQRQTTDEFLGADTALDIEEVRPTGSAGPSSQSPEERKKQFKLLKGWSDVALQDDR